MKSAATAILPEHYAPEIGPSNGGYEDVTFLFSDIVGFSEMTERLGDWHAHEIVGEHHRIVRGSVASHGGRELELRGDGFLIAFSSPSDALRCAVEIQRALRARTAAQPAHPIYVRMGLHTGPAIPDGRGYFGKNVIVAARIASLARGGEVLVSTRLRDDVEGELDLAFSASREVALKGFHGRWGVHRVSGLRPARSSPRVLERMN